MVRQVGVEEELLVVEAESGRPLAVAGRVLASAGAEAGDQGDGAPGGSLSTEFKRQQVETDTPPRTQLSDVADDLRRWRDVAASAARRAGARVVAAGTSPVEVTPELVPDTRYEQMAERYGLTATEQLTCGCHVHVSVASDDEGVLALNGLRPWLPVLLALSANSPFWQGQDAGYASFRSQVMSRWPGTGPTDLFASGEHYRTTVARMVATGVLLDEAMVYFDARLSSRYPTVEIRVADVCLDVRDTVVIAALSRALVDTSVAEADAGLEPQTLPSSMLRLATWQASRAGVEGDLLDPLTCRPRPAADVVASLLEHVRPALAANGDEHAVETRLSEMLTVGNGATRQRRVLERTNRLTDVVADLARVTAGMDA